MPAHGVTGNVTIIVVIVPRKYQKKITLNQLNDFIEIEAHNSVKKRILKSGK